MTDRGKVLIFAGTTEGRMLTEFLGSAGVHVHACVATDYGKQLIDENEFIEVSAARLDADGMCDLMRDGHSLVVDATHPYASVVSGNIKKACSVTQLEYVRLLRAEGARSHDNIISVPDVASAAECLRGTEGNVLVATGSKELAKFMVIENYRERLYARVLSLPAVVAACAELGFEGKNLICMQGPFSEELNYGMMKQIDAKYMVTKDSGRPGGFDDKMKAARRVGVKVILVGRPTEDAGMSFSDVIGRLRTIYDLPDAPSDPSGIRTSLRKITLVGIGMGRSGGLTVEAAGSIAEADLLMGAERMIGSVDTGGKDVFKGYLPKDIISYLDEHTEYRNAVVLLSGDVGFYSGAKLLLENIDRTRYDVDVRCGISSVVYLCAKLEIPWQDAFFMSSHGREANIVGAVSRHKRVFVLMDGGEGARRMCSDLVDYGMDHVKVVMGQDLGQETETISSGYPSELAGSDLGRLCVALILNDAASTEDSLSIPDRMFTRGGSPMTKSEIRALSVAKLKLCDDSVVYDIGAGTGSVSVGMALAAVNGRVYAIEKEEDAVEIIRANKKKFRTPNLEIIEGVAPMALADLPAPTHAFIGGSSGNLKDIVEALIAKNPGIRMVINAVTLETVSDIMECIRGSGLVEEEIVCVSVSRSKNVGGYHLMASENPVYISVCEGRGK